MQSTETFTAGGSYAVTVTVTSGLCRTTAEWRCTCGARSKDALTPVQARQEGQAHALTCAPPPREEYAISSDGWGDH